MDDSKIKLKNKSFVNSRKEIKSPKQRSRIIFHKPAGVIQSIKRKKRNALSEDDMNEKKYRKKDVVNEKPSQNKDQNQDQNEIVTEKKPNLVDEEFDSDEHIENENDWHKHLDVVAMPHLLGPSATKYSPVPVEYQHLSTFPVTTNPFSCQQILIQFIDSKPVISTVSCPMHYNPFHYSPYNYDPYYYNSPYYQSSYYNDPSSISRTYQRPYY